MGVTISRQAFALLDKKDGKADGKVHLQDVQNLDTDGQQGISHQEAERAGLDPKLFADDIGKLNLTLRESKDFSPSQVIFNSPTSISASSTPHSKSIPTPESAPSPPIQEPDPGLFSEAEIKELTRKGLHKNQKPHELAFSLANEAFKINHDTALRLINKNSSTIASVAEQHNINPKVLGAIIYDEIRHVKPIIEDITTATNTGETFGLAQLSNQELIRQGFFDDKGLTPLIQSGAYDRDIQGLKQAGRIPAGVQPRSITPTQLRQHLNPNQVLARFPTDMVNRGKSHLLNPQNNIEKLGAQLSRIRKEQGLPRSERLNGEGFQGKHQIARVVIFHSGRLNYGSRILRYMADKSLESAVAGKYKSPVGHTENSTTIPRGF